jgi:hypothetical protein
MLKRNGLPIVPILTCPVVPPAEVYEGTATDLYRPKRNEG